MRVEAGTGLLKHCRRTRFLLGCRFTSTGSVRVYCNASFNSFRGLARESGGGPDIFNHFVEMHHTLLRLVGNAAAAKCFATRTKLVQPITRVSILARKYNSKKPISPHPSC
jgi:hypothetical protein